MKKILIALDYNPTAEKVAETAYGIATKLQAEIMLVHVITEPAYYAMEYSPIMGYVGGYTSGTVDLVEDITREAQRFLDASVKHLGNSNIQTRVLDGDTAASIINFSEEWHADLIIMGSHSHKGLQRLLESDVAAHVLKHSKIPLLTIPTE